MNYTENYHLPQWDENDRILRTDFNQMCADIDSGLVGSKENGVTLRSESLNRFCRMAYNHYCAVQNMSPRPNQIGVFRQDPAKDASGVTGTRLLNDVRFATKSDIVLTAEDLVGNLQSLNQLVLVKGNLNACAALTASFTPPASGQVASFVLRGSYTDNTPGTVAKFRLMMTNQDTGSVELSMDMTTTLTSESAAMLNQSLSGVIPFIGGVQYAITLQPLNAVCNMDASIAFVTRPSIQTYTGDGIVTASYTIHEPEGGLGGMAILHCMANGAGGELTFSWDGVEREPVTCRLASVGDEKAFREYIYLRDDAIPADSTLALRFVCETGGSFQFYDWGAVLF